MDHAAHVRLVDPHAEGHRGHHDLELAALEGGLDAIALSGVHARVIGRAGELFGQHVGQGTPHSGPSTCLLFKGAHRDAWFVAVIGFS